MAIDPVASALDAIASHLDTEVSSLAASRRGWPEHGVDLDLSNGPIVAVVAGEVTEERCNPFSVGESTTAGTMTVTYKVASLVFPVQVDLWAAYRAQLDDAVAAVDAALANQVPATSGLWLTQDNYYSRPLSGTVTGHRRQDDAESGELGQWRATWNLEVVTDKVVQTTHPAITEIITSITTLDLLTAAGVAPWFMSTKLGAIIRRAVTTSLTSGETKLFRRRAVDYITNSLAGYCEEFVETQLDLTLSSQTLGPNTAALIGGFTSWLEARKGQNQIQAYSIDPWSENIQADIDAGRWTIAITIKLYSMMEEIVLKANIGETVTISEA